MKAPVSACLIVRDDEHLEKAVASIRPYVAEVCVVDTGSSTDTLRVIPQIADKWIRGGNSTVRESCNDSEDRIADFSAARNASFALATQPWILWLDSDDIVEGGEHLERVIREAERARNGRDVRIFAPYEYAYDHDGDCRLLQRRERIVNRDAFHWERPIHEGLVPNRPSHAIDSHTELLVWKHQRQYTDTEIKGTRDADRNHRILTAHEDRDDARWLYDMGSELTARAQVERSRALAVSLDEEALALFLRSSDVSAKSEEKAAASLQCATIALRSAIRATIDDGKPFDLRGGSAYVFDAMHMRPDWDAPYFALAKLHYIAASSFHASEADSRRHLEHAMHFARAGLAMPAPLTTWPLDPQDRSLRAHEILHDGYARTGDLERATEHVELALKAKPRAAHLHAARRHYEATQCRARITADLASLRKAGGIDDGAHELLLDGMSNPDRLKETVRRGMANVAQIDRPGVLRIAFSCGLAFEEWNPAILEEHGLGGSETAVVEMAKRLAALGHEVTVYGNIGEEKDYDGVQYKRAGKVYTAAPVDVLVAWRNAALLEEDAGPASVGARVLWVHDIDPFGATYARMLKADRVFALSAWHRQHLIAAHHLSEKHVVQTRNGIDLARFEQTVERNPQKAIYSSSPDRGLAQLLEMWPRIRESVTDAELHVFYGFEMAEKVARETRDKDFAARLAGLRARAEALAGQGVVLRGKVDQYTLAREMLSAGAWLYPSVLHDGMPFYETSCISAMEAQAAGLRIVAPGHGALQETCRVVATAVEYFAEQAIAVLTQHSDRETMAGIARALFSWDPVAVDWADLFRDLLEEKADVFLPAYSEAAE